MPWTAVVFVVVLLVLLILWRSRSTFLALFGYVALNGRSEQKASLTAIVDIFTSGSHHIEFSPPVTESSEPEYVKLAVAYVANVAFVIAKNPPGIKAILVDLLSRQRQRLSITSGQAI